MKFTSTRRSEDTFDLTPLIDVVFLLLIFFMVSTTFIREPGGIRVDLPHSDTQEFIREGEDPRYRAFIVDDHNPHPAQSFAFLRATRR